MSGLLVPLAFIPLEVVKLYRSSWLISGVLGNALCKLIPFLFEVSCIVSIQSLVLRASGSIWSCGVAPPFHIDQFEKVYFWHPRHQSCSHIPSRNTKAKHFAFFSGKKALENLHHLLTMFLPIT